jgi:hypothetical protein
MLCFFRTINFQLSNDDNGRPKTIIGSKKKHLQAGAKNSISQEHGVMNSLELADLTA